MSGIKLWINEKGVSEQIENQRPDALSCMHVRIKSNQMLPRQTDSQTKTLREMLAFFKQ